MLRLRSKCDYRFFLSCEVKPPSSNILVSLSLACTLFVIWEEVSKLHLEVKLCPSVGIADYCSFDTLFVVVVVFRTPLRWLCLWVAQYFVLRHGWHHINLQKERFMPVEKQLKSYHIEKRKGRFFAEVPHCSVATSKSNQMEITIIGKRLVDDSEL